MRTKAHALPSPLAGAPAPEPEPLISITPKALAALVVALVAGLSGLGWLNNRPVDHVTVREFDLFKEQQRERDGRVDAKFDELLKAIHQARTATPVPAASPRRSRK